MSKFQYNFTNTGPGWYDPNVLRNVQDSLDSVNLLTSNTTSSWDQNIDEFYNTHPYIKDKIEQEELAKKEKELRDSSPWYSKLGYALMSTPSTPGDVPSVSPQAANRYMSNDIQGAQNIQRSQDVAGTIAAASSIVAPYAIADFSTAASTYGIKRALAAEVGSGLLGEAGSQVGNWFGQTIDKNLGTNVSPWLSAVLGLRTGIKGYNKVLKNTSNLVKPEHFSLMDIQKRVLSPILNTSKFTIGMIRHPKTYYKYYKFLKDRGEDILNKNNDEIYNYFKNRSNYYTTKEFGKSISPNPKITPKYQFLKVPLKPYLGSTKTSLDEIKLNAFHPKFLKHLNKGNIASALNDLLNGTGVHELAHLNHYSSVLPPLSVKGGKYYVADPKHPLYKRVTYLFNNGKTDWIKSPDELVAEMVRSKKRLGKMVPYSDLLDREKDLLIRPLSNRFVGLSKNDIRYIVDELDGFGYKKGGKLNGKENI